MTWRESMPTVQIPGDVRAPLSYHLVELERRLITWLFTVVIVALVWVRRIDGDLEHLLERVSPCGLSCLVAYNPAAWVSIKWTSVALASTICTMPLLAVLLDRFASPGLLPSERRAWRLGLFIVGVGSPLMAWVFVWEGLPWLFEVGASDVGRFGLTPAYDVGTLFAMLVAVCGLSTILLSGAGGLSCAVGLGAVRSGSLDAWRMKCAVIAAVAIGVVGSPLPFDLLGLVWLIGLGMSEMLLRASVPASRSRYASAPSGESPNRGAVLDCRCAGACPSLTAIGEQPEGWGVIHTDALCLHNQEQMLLVDLAHRWALTDLIVLGCDGTPMPRSLIGALGGLDIRIGGADWMDLGLDPLAPGVHDSEELRDLLSSAIEQHVSLRALSESKTP